MKLQGPKGARDFYPAEMAQRNYLLDAWRTVSVRNGFEQIDGPIFELLDLYKVKSGEGIVSELFHFEDRGGRGLAIRPEFTPTLARMAAQKASGLPRPVKWFCTPNFCRAERPQRGRLREFWQWNADILGLDSPLADAEIIFTAIDLLATLGLKPTDVRVKISHRATVRHVLLDLGVSENNLPAAFDLLDRRDKMQPKAFTEAAGALGLAPGAVERFEQLCRSAHASGRGLTAMKQALGDDQAITDLEALDEQLRAFDIADWCEYDLGVVRGLAYYTGVVFEIHEASGAERAIAGGGRYDNLIELFGGPSMPAVGMGMGDVVLSLVLADKGLLPDNPAPKPDAFVAAITDAGAAQMTSVVAQLRQTGLHARFNYKATRNIGKLLKDAAACSARFAVILDDHVQDGLAQVKNLDAGDQTLTPIADLPFRLARE